LPGYDPEKRFFHDIRGFLFSKCLQIPAPPDGMDRQGTFGSGILQILSHWTAAPVGVIPGSPEINGLDSPRLTEGFL
jgi:hypothetical protein